MMSMGATFDEHAIAAILTLTEDDLAIRFVDTRRRMRDALPPKCVDDVLCWSRERKIAYRIVLGEAAVFALGRDPRSMCNRLDELGAEHNALIDRASDYDSLSAGSSANGLVARRLRSGWLAERDLLRTAAEMTFARLLGLRSVLHVQLNRESFERDGMFVPVEWRLLVIVDRESSPPLELVPVDPPPPGGDSASAPTAEVGTDQPGVDSETERRYRDRYGLGFLFT